MKTSFTNAALKASKTVAETAATSTNSVSAVSVDGNEPTVAIPTESNEPHTPVENGHPHTSRTSLVPLSSTIRYINITLYNENYISVCLRAIVSRGLGCMRNLCRS